MRGFVLAAGFGTRLQPITDVIPKAIVSVCGVPLMEIALRYLRKNNFDTYCVNIHYQAELAEMFIEQLPYKVKTFNEQPEILGTGGAIYNARDFLKGDSFCVMNADIVTNAPLKLLTEKFEESTADVVLIASSDRGAPSVSIDANNRYIGPVSNTFGDEDRQAAFIGMTLYKKEALDFFKEDDFSVLPVWKRIAEAGLTVEVWDLADFYWQDTGKPAELTELYWDILDKKIKFDFPMGMVIDHDKKLAYPDTFDPSIITKNSEYVWIEQVLASKIDAKRTVFHGGTSVDAERFYEDQIIVPWAEVSSAAK